MPAGDTVLTGIPSSSEAQPRRRSSITIRLLAPPTWDPEYPVQDTVPRDHARAAADLPRRPAGHAPDHRRAGPGEVLIRVTAAGVNFADISKAGGTFLDGPRPPYLAGFEAAREIVAVGEAVTRPQLGARVVGVGNGAFAEYMALPVAAAMPVPPGWTEQEALGLVVNWPTALAALKPLGGITAGQTVLIHAASGATGQAAVTMAKRYGATVIATASPGRHETVLALGADHVLGTPGDWRMIATTANGQPAAVVYHRDADGVLRADGAVVLAATATGVSRVIKFHDPALVATFGFPDVLAHWPAKPGKRYEDWELTDPAGQPIEVVREVCDDIRRRVEKLVAELQAA
jgi:NADPH:quinone reductase-like Zn-dependent oxidoreductase